MGYLTHTRAPGLPPVPWGKLALDFTCLSGMQFLSALKIGRLATLEALGRAKVVQHLQHLTLLSLSACYLIAATDDTRWLRGSPDRVSALVLSIKAFSSLLEEMKQMIGEEIAYQEAFPVSELHLCYSFVFDKDLAALLYLQGDVYELSEIGKEQARVVQMSGCQ